MSNIVRKEKLIRISGDLKYVIEDLNELLEEYGEDASLSVRDGSVVLVYFETEE